MVSVGDEGLRVLADGLPALRGLAIESAIFLTDSGTRYLFEGDASIAARLRVRERQACELEDGFKQKD